MNKILKPMCKYLIVHPLKETKRFAVTSKWQNIKLINESKDNEKPLMIEKHLRRMKAAIAEVGNAFPDNNMPLAYLIDQAKIKKVPDGTVKAFLNRMQSTKINCHNVWFNVQGPGGCLLVFHTISDNPQLTKHNIISMLRKCMCKIADESVESAFDIQGVIITEKFTDIDAATDIGIEIGAEDVSEIDKDGKPHLKFTCNPEHRMVVKRNLEKLGHTIITAEAEYIPISLIEVPDEGLHHISKLIDRVKGIEDVVAVYDNIA